MGQIYNNRMKNISGILFLLLSVFYIYGYSKAPDIVSNKRVEMSGNQSGQLPYSEGGAQVEDPGLQADNNLYIDALEGNDNWIGSKDYPLKTMSKAIIALQDLPAGTQVLLRRGRDYSGITEFNYFNGEEGKRYVLGAYGPLDEPKPRMLGDVRIRYCSYWMVRDLDVNGQLLYFMTHHSVIFNNEVHGWQSNGIAVMGGTHYIAVVDNLVYDGNNNDAISLHDSSSKIIPEEIYLGNHFWVVDNIVIGNDGIEECIDVASNGWRYGYDCSQDIKIINNRLQCKAVAPSLRTGACVRPFNLAHTKKYVWVIGNIGTNGKKQGIYITDTSEFPQALDHIQFSSNIIFGNTQEILSSSATNTTFKHNTLLTSSTYTAVTFAAKTADVVFTSNIVKVTVGKIYSFASGIHMPAIDYNWYSPELPSPQVQGDLHSEAGAIPGVGIPPSTIYNDDPENWYNADFLNYFIPDPLWEGNNMDVVPGAFLADGTWQGLTIEPFPGYENNGYGWEGPLLIQERYPIEGLGTGTPKIPEMKEKLDMDIYPNPSKKEGITIKFTLPEISDVVINIMDTNGKTIKAWVDKKQAIGTHVLLVDTVNYKPGVYFCELIAGKNSSVSKFIVQ